MRRSPGTGTITPRKEGGFMARLPDRHRTSLGVFPTRQEASDILDAAIVELVDGRVTTAKSLYSFGLTVIDRRELDGYRGVASERARWKSYVQDWEPSKWPPRAIDRVHVLAWTRELRRQGLATQTIKNALSLLRIVLSAALDERLVDHNAAFTVRVRDHGRTTETMHVLHLEELAGLVFSATAESLEGAILIAVAAGAGLRQGEQRSLRWEDVFLEGDEPALLIRYGAPRKPRKNGKVLRVPLFGLALEAMRAWRRARPKATGLVWPTSEGHARWQGKLIARESWKGWLAKAGIERRVRWHDLRHTCATLLLHGQLTPNAWSLEEVKDMLGHSSLTVTERYAKADGTLAEAAARRHFAGTRAIPAALTAADKASELLRSRLGELDPGPTVYESRAFAGNREGLARARTFVVSTLQHVARVGDLGIQEVEALGKALDELDGALDARSPRQGAAAG